MARRLGLGLDPTAPGITVAEFLDAWLAGKQRVKRASTARSYEAHCRVWLKPQLGHLALERLNAGHVEGLFATIGRFNSELERQRGEGKALIAIEGDVRGQPRICGLSTQRRIFATLRAALNAAVRQRKITYNPCTGIELEPEAAAEAQRWTPEQAWQFIGYVADDPMMGLMFRVMVLTGCRRGELCGLRWSFADLEVPYRDPETGEQLMGAVLTVASTILQLGGKLVAGKPKTKAGERLIFVDAETAELLRQCARHGW